MYFLFHIVSNNGYGLSATRIPKSVEVAGNRIPMEIPKI
jgi:hypothetical protein